ncbi:ATP-grasp domain-containing protein [Pontibacter harenae]|uniref:ATP-grasp domain-containing protein n=1 Tax=Pontibacter harenae TaxID=2894083 RepID=UPI001E444AD3|nr:hypothetical protein [Pontibacter harenae]MCC9168736.1 hypothetical protein [Pontibacter harenae]
MQNLQIALVTCFSLGGYTANADSEDERLFNYLKEKGVNVSFQVWDDATVDWASFDALVIKSPWDYFDKIDAFYEWLDKVENLGCQVFNSIDTIRWNTDKKYFKDLAAQGVAVVPTVWLEQESQFTPAAIFEALQTDHLIVKPRISGGAKNTFAVHKSDVTKYTDKVNELLKSEPLMAQPFLEEVKTQGEWSFLFFNGTYSHAVLKTAKPGDFRVQHFFGGTIHTPEPPAGLLKSAQQTVDKFASNCLYARVDGVELHGELVLMELELIEPFLFLSTNEHALARYIDALTSLLQVREPSLC